MSSERRQTDPHRKFECGMPNVIYVRKTKQASPINSTLKDNHFNKLIVHFSGERPSVYHLVDLFYLLFGRKWGAWHGRLNLTLCVCVWVWLELHPYFCFLFTRGANLRCFPNWSFNSMKLIIVVCYFKGENPISGSIVNFAKNVCVWSALLGSTSAF